MGSTAVIYGVVALALALVCLFLGFFWGRSNVKLKLEQAFEQDHVSLDAREFAMRQQLDDAMAEVARLRPLAEELGRVQERLKLEQSKYEQMKTEFSSTLRSDSKAPGEQEQRLESAPAPKSADEAIQRLMQSLETLDKPPEQPGLPINESQPQPSKSNAPQVPQFVEKQQVVEKQPDVRTVEKTPSAPKALEPRPQGDDEWQEFARSLADLARSTQPKQ